MKTSTLIKHLIVVCVFLNISMIVMAQQEKRSSRLTPNNLSIIPHVNFTKQDEQNRATHLNSGSQVCNDTVYSIPQSRLYFCLGGKCDPSLKLYFEINGSHSAGATIDSSIVWLMTDDKDGPGPLSSIPDSMTAGHDIRNSTNRAKWFGGFTPSYISNNPLNWISPYSFQYFLPVFWSDSGRAICFTPIAFDSLAAGHSFELDSCQGYGQPIQKIVVRAIYAGHFYSCDSGINHLHLFTRGGLPQYNHYNGYGNSSMYTITINSQNYNSHWGDTLIVPALDENFISISDSLSNNGIADGCVIYNDTLNLYPPLSLNNFYGSYYDDLSPNDTFSVSTKPSGAIRIDYLVSDPASDGIYLLNAVGDTIFSEYSDGFPDILNTLYIYDIPLSNGPFRIVATNDFGSGWQDATCYSLPNDGHLKIFDLSTNDSISATLYPIGDGHCGINYIVDTFGVYNIGQYNKTHISIDPSPTSLSGVDSLGIVIFSPSVAGAGNYLITFSYNDTKSNLCDKDTVINVSVNSSVGMHDLHNGSNIIINNPVHDLLFIKQTDSKINNILLNDVTGKNILERNISKEQIIDVSEIVNGIYFIKFFDSDYSLIAVKKIIKY